MKKLITLLPALAILFSLCACGAGSAPLSENATDFDYNAFCDAVETNELKAKETYVGNAYYISAFVTEISDEYCILAFYDTYDSDYRIRVEFDKEVLMELETYQRINIIGRIDDISIGFIEIKEAEYLDGITQLPATVLSVVYASAGDEKPSYCIARITDFVDWHLSLYCIVRLSGDESATLEKGDEITVSGTLYTKTYDYDDVHMYLNKKVPLEFRDAELIS